MINIIKANKVTEDKLKCKVHNSMSEQENCDKILSPSPFNNEGDARSFTPAELANAS